MKTVVPNYYHQFKCIASKCKHSCCLGWEIDIDDDSLAYFHSVEGNIGDKLRKNIVLPQNEEEVAHFQLGENERCPFLNECNLCELILELGEDSLCQICTDHPRFRNFWTDRTEIGLGLACEEACRIILSQEEKTEYIVIEDDEVQEEVFEDEQEIFELREELLKILQDRTYLVDQRIINMLDYCEFDTSQIKYIDGPLNEIACEQFAVYLLYRNYADVLYDDRLKDRIMFVANNYMKVRNEWASNGKTDIESLIEPARSFSQKIEYDTDTWGIE